jgi:uncharacterized membrane protein
VKGKFENFLRDYRLFALTAVLWALALLVYQFRTLLPLEEKHAIVLALCLALVAMVVFFLEVVSVGSLLTPHPFQLTYLFLLSGLFILVYAMCYALLGMKDGDVKSNDFWTALYFSVVTWTTLGYGDVSPSPESRPFAALEAVTGYFASALIIAALVNWFSQRPERD